MHFGLEFSEIGGGVMGSVSFAAESVWGMFQSGHPAKYDLKTCIYAGQSTLTHDHSHSYASMNISESKDRIQEDART